MSPLDCALVNNLSRYEALETVCAITVACLGFGKGAWRARAYNGGMGTKLPAFACVKTSKV